MNRLVGVAGLAAAPLIGWAAVLFVPTGPVLFPPVNVPTLRIPCGLLMVGVFVIGAAKSGTWITAPAVLWGVAAAVAWTPDPWFAAVGWVPPGWVPTGLMTVAVLWCWCLAWRVAFPPADDEEDEEVEPERRVPARFVEPVPWDPVIDVGHDSDGWEAPPREPVLLRSVPELVDTSPADEPDPDDEGVDIVEILDREWPPRRRTEKGAVHLADLAQLTGWDEANLAAELRACGIPVEEVSARPLHVKGGTSTTKNGVRFRDVEAVAG